MVEAARLRFRPILMTSLAFILGVAPLAFSSGAGAGARQSMGTGVLGGMLGATFLAVFFVPLFFKLLNDRRFKTTKEDFDHPRACAAAPRVGHQGISHEHENHTTPRADDRAGRRQPAGGLRDGARTTSVRSSTSPPV